VANERDYYSILELNRNASQDAIERAYRRLSALYDPATSRKPRAAQRHAAIQEAYDVLGDRQRRSQYDRGLARSGGRGPIPGSIRPSDAFSNKLVLGGAAMVVGSIVGILALILVIGGGGEASPPLTTRTPDPGAPTPAPDTPPDVEGEEVTTESGLTIIHIREGDGESPNMGDFVEVHYTGWLEEDGTKFDSSVDRGQPSTFALGQVIEGWNEGLQLMRVGGLARLIIPSELAYGEAGRPSIPPNANLIFDVELLGVEPVATPQPDDDDGGDNGGDGEETPTATP
jgi:hypothetical protein